MIRNLVNFIVTFVVFWLGNHYFHEYVSIADTKTLLLATVFMFVIGILLSLLSALSILTIPLGIGCLTTIILFFVDIFLTPIKLWLLDTYLPGFAIHGFWTYVCLTVALSIFSIRSKSSQSESN